ncbi:MAG: hypothetical protein EOO24_29970 [Comamonadaceae bacterium]|nr:MAG: hypothetical protein EOO24_29970 [Comamonadaceae bacterium]
MILAVNADHTVVLEDAGDFRRFHLEIDPALDLDAARSALAGVAHLESADKAWVDRPALYSLGRDAGGEAWETQADAMLQGAARHGWVRGHEPSIQSHVVWRR